MRRNAAFSARFSIEFIRVDYALELFALVGRLVAHRRPPTAFVPIDRSRTEKQT